jgi:outer membrane protein OmpA-like peptidoglycan-associated protein
MIKYINQMMLIVLLAISLNACSTARENYDNSNDMAKGAVIGASAGAVTGAVVPAIGVPAGAVGGMAIGALVGLYLDDHHSVRDKLRARDVQVIQLGDYVKLVIPSSQLFVGHSHDLTASAKETLNLVAKLLGSIPKLTVTVSAFTYPQGSKLIEQNETTHQAQAVSHFLWSQGADSRLILAEGYGSTHRVTNDSNSLNENYRIEITLKKVTEGPL